MTCDPIPQVFRIANPGAGASSPISLNACPESFVISTVPFSGALLRDFQTGSVGPGTMLITLKYEHRCPRNRERYSCRIRKNAGHPDSRLSSWLSQSSVLANRLWTTRTRHFPPARASTVHSVAIGGASGPKPEPSSAYL